MKRIICVASYILCITASNILYAQNCEVTESKTTSLTVTIPTEKIAVDPMIYGQMIEDCNDQVIYGGIVNNDGKENSAVTELLRPLNIPVMRWPAGTAIYDYEWKKGIGKNRKAEKEHIWGGMEYYTFGTDEFITWCERLNIEPYINIPMGNNNTYTHSLGNALDWIEYVNGPTTTTYGALRAKNGHHEPYDVKLWCIGNENYLGNRFHKSESAETYANNLAKWSKVIKSIYPDLRLLGVGRVPEWTKEVLKKCNEWIDYVTLHFYISAHIDNNALVDQEKSLFSAALAEANLKQNIEVLKAANAQYGRVKNPIRFSIDEWNNRHAVNNGEKFIFSRKDDRRQYDVITTATMLNVFLRNSPYVGMANYIFPVNGHGLIKTVGESDAYRSVVYYVFELYRKHLVGNLLHVDIEGAGIADARLGDYARLVGDITDETRDMVQDLCFVDAATTMNEYGEIYIALTNRSHNATQKIKINLPDGYHIDAVWSLESKDISTANTADNRNKVQPILRKEKKSLLSLLPCGLKIVKCVAK